MNILVAKISVIILWGLLGFSFVYPFSANIQTPLEYLGAIIALVHLIEFIIQRNKLNAINAGGVNGFVQTMIFGFGYWLPLLKKQD